MENEIWRKYYDIAASYFRGDLALLFQRVNYFLVATAFLIGGFIAINVGSNFKINPNSDSFYLALTITIVGILISYGFSVVNFLNAKIVFLIGEYVQQIEEGETCVPPFRQINIIAAENKFSFLLLIYVYIHTLAYIGRVSIDKLRGKKTSEHREYIELAPHTWLLPMFFAVVWTVFLTYVAVESPLKYLAYSIFALLNLFFIIGMKLFASRLKCAIKTILTIALAVLFLLLSNWMLYLFQVNHLPIFCM